MLKVSKKANKLLQTACIVIVFNHSGKKFKSMKKGMIFDLYQDGRSTARVMAISETDVISLKDFEVIQNIDFENEVESILIDDIFDIE